MDIAILSRYLVEQFSEISKVSNPISSAILLGSGECLITVAESGANQDYAHHDFFKSVISIMKLAVVKEFETAEVVHVESKNSGSGEDNNEHSIVDFLVLLKVRDEDHCSSLLRNCLLRSKLHGGFSFFYSSLNHDDVVDEPIVLLGLDLYMGMLLGVGILASLDNKDGSESIFSHNLIQLGGTLPMFSAATIFSIFIISVFSCVTRINLHYGVSEMGFADDGCVGVNELLAYVVVSYWENISSDLVNGNSAGTQLELNCPVSFTNSEFILPCFVTRIVASTAAAYDGILDLPALMLPISSVFLLGNGDSDCDNVVVLDKSEDAGMEENRFEDNNVLDTTSDSSKKSGEELNKALDDSAYEGDVSFGKDIDSENLANVTVSDLLEHVFESGDEGASKMIALPIKKRKVSLVDYCDHVKVEACNDLVGNKSDLALTNVDVFVNSEVAEFDKGRHKMARLSKCNKSNKKSKRLAGKNRKTRRHLRSNCPGQAVEAHGELPQSK